METAIKQTVHLTAKDFKEKVFNYETGKEWKYEGTLPAIVDFYADWCQPCKMVAPVLEDLAREYVGQIMVYKVNTEEEQELASVFGIQSIPTLLSFRRKASHRLQWELCQSRLLKKQLKTFCLITKT
jgi:thioredoxin 1